MSQSESQLPTIPCTPFDLPHIQTLTAQHSVTPYFTSPCSAIIFFKDSSSCEDIFCSFLPTRSWISQYLATHLQERKQPCQDTLESLFSI
ncbi:hypothetical protein E2C01_081136 [Portunus trituberculatus]|uniref:Uncharacterized protein n=1 Tax=Portunus trituberculatus TaxID=210409 RepID=A0A5B7IVG2_PORTR|nr:hypothetical protein [Portunus trituberculatus]